MRQVLAVLSVVALTLLLSSGCGENGNAKQPDGSAKSEKTFPVKVMTLAPQTFKDFITVTGTVKARNHIRLMVEEGGTLKEVRVDKGRRARAGDTLSALENKVLEASFRQADAVLQQAQLDAHSKEVLYSKKAISENEYLSSRYALDAARAARELAKARYDKLFIIAPISGLVNERYYDMGAYAQPMTPIFELIDNEVLKIRAGVAERFLNDIHLGTPVEITFDALPGLVTEGEVSYISRSINPQDRTFDIEVTVTNREGRLAPEMIANVKVLRQIFRERIVVPLDALIESEDGWHVMISNDSHARRVPVSKLAVYQTQVLVDGLNPGQKLIVVGQQELSDGDSLQIIPD